MIRVPSMRTQTRSWRASKKPLFSNPVGLFQLAIGYWLFPMVGRPFNFFQPRLVYAMRLGVSHHRLALKD